MQVSRFDRQAPHLPGGDEQDACPHQKFIISAGSTERLSSFHNSAQAHVLLDKMSGASGSRSSSQASSDCRGRSGAGVLL
jgi:hypothetical protein